jgi:hypothetical protein
MAHIKNRAVFEIPEILEHIMQAEEPDDFRALSRDDTRGSVRLN